MPTKTNNFFKRLIENKIPPKENENAEPFPFGGIFDGLFNFQNDNKRKQMDKDKAKMILNEFADIADSMGIKFILIFGTLLGAIRENDFIEYDDDLDVSIYENDDSVINNLIYKLKENKFELESYNKFTEHYVLYKDSIVLDIFVAKDCEKNNFVKVLNHHFFKKYFIETKCIKFIGREFKIPKESEEFLSLHYGDNWSIPQKTNKGSYIKLENIFKKSL